MSNEEQVADTIEMLYERLNSYNKQDLFNYGYLLESNEILCKDIEEKDKEIESLNNIINELEKYINETKLEEFEKVYGRRCGKTFTQAEVIICNMILNKLHKLKGSDKEC